MIQIIRLNPIFLGCPIVTTNMLFFIKYKLCNIKNAFINLKIWGCLILNNTFAKTTFVWQTIINMMHFKSKFKVLAFILFAIGAIDVFAQRQLSGTIEWEEDLLMNATYDVDVDIPKYCAQAGVSGDVLEAEVMSSSFSYSKVGDSEAKRILAAIKLDENPDVETFLGTTNGLGVASVCFYPYVVRNGNVLKVTSYDIQIRPTKRASSSFLKSGSAASSVLSSEGWFKVSVNKTGLFKITPSFLSSNNITNTSVSINSIRVVGNGTGMLPEQNSVSRPDDLLDVPLKVYDQNNDGLFNGSDYAVFYAKGPHQWNADLTSGVFTHETNLYRDLNFYFVSVTNGAGKTVSVIPALTASATVQSSSYDDYDFRESETYNLVGTGRQWLGDVFDVELNKGYGFAFLNMDVSSPMRLRVQAAARSSSGNTFMRTQIGNQNLQNIRFKQYSTFETSNYVEVSDSVRSFNFTGNPGGFTVQLTYDNSANPSAVAWLDFIEIQCRRNLIYAGVPILFRDMNVVGPSAIAEYTINQAPSGMSVWKVTDHNNVVEIPVNRTGSIVSFKDNAVNLEEYVAFAGSNFSEPEFVGVVQKQNLHSMAPSEMIIITHPKFLLAANRLALFHTNYDGIETKVVSIHQVYNEFSSGGQDITAIRDFSKFMYEKAQSTGVDFRYLLLFGDASYDYKDRIANNNNYIPIWESNASYNLQLSSITDDYYGLLDLNEGGNGSIASLSGQTLDIGIGRIPCETVSQADAAVNKIINYTSGDNRFGNWRNKILMMADDLDDDQGWESMFVTSSEMFTGIINNANSAFNVEKIYTDSYKQVSTTGGESYPEAHDDMFRKVEQGCLITNYIGHGGEIGLTSEKLLGLQDVNSWTNFDALSLFMTITCEFTRVDDPKRVSAGEQLALNANGGAIALISTTRVVSAGPAVDLNEEVLRTAFERPNNEPKTLGEIVMTAKNKPRLVNGGTRLKFSLIGDPAVKLAMPYYRMQVNEVNGVPVSAGGLDTLKALSKVKVSGQVNDFSDQKISNFTGITSVSVYDKPTDKKTLVNDGIGNPIPFKLQSSLLYKGKVEVKNGDFSFEFIVPKDISFQYGFGKISLYANDGVIDAGGSFDTILVGGFNQNPVADDEGPIVELYINDETFVRGGVTDENPELYAIISDSSGINTVGNKIGHNLKAVLDNDESQAYIINEYYEADLNSYQSGKVIYPFYKIAEGSHTLSLEVFDVHNNVSFAETEFIVADSEGMALKRVLNYPNPFTTYTEFQFEHNRADQPLEVQVQIFTVSGKLVKTINKLVISQGNRVSNQITWNGLDDYGDKIGKGVYVYRVKVKSQLDNSTADKYEKLVILR